MFRRLLAIGFALTFLLILLASCSEAPTKESYVVQLAPWFDGISVIGVTEALGDDLGMLTLGEQ